MHRLVAAGVVAVFFLIVLSGKGFAQNSTTPITDCEDITQPGNYVLTNDLELIASSRGYGQGGDCLVVTSSHVNIDMGGWTIYVACVPICPPDFYGPVGGTAIHVMNGADHVSISNGGTQDFVYGISAEADHISATNLSLRAVLGISLNNVSHGNFTNIDYRGADERYHGSNGPIISLSGGSHNAFQNLSGFTGGGFLSVPGIVIANSSHNTIDHATIDCTAEQQAGPGILLGGDHNSITNSNIFVLFGNGIEVDLGSDHNFIQGNTVEILSPPGYFAMLDENPNCGHDVWIDNTFGAFGGLPAASPANCID
jgi:hypothetical protein